MSKRLAELKSSLERAEWLPFQKLLVEAAVAHMTALEEELAWYCGDYEKDPLDDGLSIASKAFHIQFLSFRRLNHSRRLLDLGHNAPELVPEEPMVRPNGAAVG